jgi:hypothetical protein
MDCCCHYSYRNRPIRPIQIWAPGKLGLHGPFTASWTWPSAGYPAFRSQAGNIPYPTNGQAQQFLSLYGSIVNQCFKDCVNDFTSETLAESEVTAHCVLLLTLYRKTVWRSVLQNLSNWQIALACSWPRSKWRLERQQHSIALHSIA